MSRIVVLGDLNLDVLARLPGALPQEGEIRTVVQTLPGGSAGNFARAAAGEGATITLIGCVGGDLVGELLVRSLQAYGIDTQVKRVDLPTGTIVSLRQGEGRTMLCSRGANDGLDPSWIKAEWFRGASHLHLSGYSFLSPSQRQAARRAIEIARASEMTISADPPPANLIHAFGVAAFLSELAAVDWLFPNLDEGRALSEKGIPEEIAAALAEAFPIGALTLGGEGSLAWQGDERDRCNAEKIEVTDTTGAGDAFAAGFVATYLKGRDLSTANRRGNEVALKVLKGRRTPPEKANLSVDLRDNIP